MSSATERRVAEARESVENLAASETTSPDVIDDALSDLEAAVREDERARLTAFGALSDPNASRGLRAAAREVLAYMEEINTYRSADERVAAHFRWRGDSDRAVLLFARLRDAARGAS